MSELTIIAIGDPHFQTDNISEVCLFIDRLEKFATERHPDLIVILGDILHTHERIHTTPLNKAYEFVDRMRKIAPTVVLVGNHDMCLAKNTPVLMWNGDKKMSQDIIVGDVLVGDDGKSRTVTHTNTGTSEMYQIKQLDGMDYSVSKDHILSLKCGSSKSIIDLCVQDYLRLPKTIQNILYGFNKEGKDTAITVEPTGKTDEYFGWTVDGNGRYLLGDGTVTHNCNNQVFLQNHHWMNAMKEWKNVDVADRVIHKKLNGVQLVFVPYVPPGRFQHALNTVCTEDMDWKKADCIFAHQEFYGCKMGAIVSVDGDRWPETFPPIVSGHIHSRQQPQKNIYYCGAAMQHAFGESEKNIIPVMTFSPIATKQKTASYYNLEEFDLMLPRKRIVYSDIDSITDVKLPSAESQDKVKLTVTGNYEEFKAFRKTKKYRELVQTGTKVVFKPRKIQQTAADDKRDEKTTDPKSKPIIVPLDENDFSKILYGLVVKDKNPLLLQVYESVMNNKEIGEADTIFL